MYLRTDKHLRPVLNRLQFRLYWRRCSLISREATRERRHPLQAHPHGPLSTSNERAGGITLNYALHSPEQHLIAIYSYPDGEPKLRGKETSTGCQD